MEKDAASYDSSDKYNAPANESVENERSERTVTEQTEMETTVSMTNNNGPDNISFQTGASGSSVTGQAVVKTVYLQHLRSFELPPYEAVQTLQPIQNNHSRERNKKNKNENIRLTETLGESCNCQPSQLERRTEEEAQKRIDSFKNCQNKQQVQQAVPLAEAGFYFTDIGEVRCFACGIKFEDWTTEENVWEWHARYSSSCPHVKTEGKRYFEMQYLDLKSKKKQDLGNNRKHLQLIEWLLCKICYMNTSDLVLIPCRHVCICFECADRVTVCPSCNSHILQHVQVTLEI